MAITPAERLLRVMFSTETCPVCHGSGEDKDDRECENCDGTGVLDMQALKPKVDGYVVRPSDQEFRN